MFLKFKLAFRDQVFRIIIINEQNYLRFNGHYPTITGCRGFPLLSDALNYQQSAREIKRRSGGFVPEWKNLQTWINQKCWEEEIETNNISNGTNKKSGGASNEAIARIIAEKFGSDSR